MERTSDEQHWTFPQRSKLGREDKLSEITGAIIGPLLIFTTFILCLGFLLWSDCGDEKEEGKVFIETIFDVFEDCGRGVTDKQISIRNTNHHYLIPNWLKRDMLEKYSF